MQGKKDENIRNKGCHPLSSWGPKRAEKMPAAHFQRRPDGSPGHSVCEGSVLGCNLDRSIVMYKIVRIPLRGAQDDAGSDHLKALFGVKFKNQWGKKLSNIVCFLYADISIIVNMLMQ